MIGVPDEVLAVRKRWEFAMSHHPEIMGVALTKSEDDWAVAVMRTPGVYRGNWPDEEDGVKIIYYTAVSIEEDK